MGAPMQRLRAILLKPVERNERTLRYQHALDNQVARDLPSWDVERGLIGSRGVHLPHKSVAKLWETPYEERVPQLSPEAEKVYLANSHRGCTPSLSLAASCWHSPLSRFHGDERLLRFFANGLDFFTSTIRADGSGLGQMAPAIRGLSNYPVFDWSHTWVMEGLIYGLIRCWDALAPDRRERALSNLRRAARAFLKIGPSGEYGNQAVIQCLGLYLYADLFADDRFRERADAYWADVFDRVFDPSGQVIEQGGPCMHYQFTAFFYTWLTMWFRGEDFDRERLGDVLHWMRCRHTDSLYPLAGPGSRQYRETLNRHADDLVPACEQMAADDPTYQEYADRILAAIGWDAILEHNCMGHGNSPYMWAMLTCPGKVTATASQRAAWHKPFRREYRRIRLAGRADRGEFAPLRYALVRQRYQTAYVFNDRLPFSGIQTWAWEEEPPIIHPTPLCPSTTQAWGLDTAQQGVSMTWPRPQTGPKTGGLNRPDHLMCSSLNTRRDVEPDFLIARYNTLWRLVVFTEYSTVILECGATGPRQCRWTLNRVEPAEPVMGRAMVRFRGRSGCIFSTLQAPPVLRDMGRGEWLDGVRVLVYDCLEGPTAFAFSNASFRFVTPMLPGEREFRFADEGGAYRAHLPDLFPLDGEPANPPVGAFEMVEQTVVERV